MLLEPVPFIHEAIWEAHVQQLKACPNCGRTFFPDRIKVSMSLFRIIFPKLVYHLEIFVVIFGNQKSN